MKKLFMILAGGALLAFSACTESSENVSSENVSSVNSALDNIMTRTSVRNYTSRAVSEDTVTLLLKAAMAAPTAVNSQPWAFVVIRDEDKRSRLAEALPNAGDKLTSSSVNIVVCGDKRKMFEKEPMYWVQDCSAATENLLLAANALGLGAVWCGVYPSEERVSALRDAIGLDPNLIPLCIVPVGYPSQDRVIKDKWKPENIIYM